MTWFKVDDGLHSHRKVKSISRRDRAAAMGLWVLAGSWCADNLTDGHVPTYMIDELGCTTRNAQSLVTAHLWLETDDGYQFHAWNEPGRQPARAEVEDSREAERKRKAAYRARMSQRDRDGTDSAQGPPEPHAGLAQASGEPRAGLFPSGVDNPGAEPRSDRATDGPRSEQSMSQRDIANVPPGVPPVSQRVSGHPDPTRPDLVVVPSELPNPSSEPSSDAEPGNGLRPDVEELCQHLADRIEANGSKRPRINRGWRDACRRLIDLDGRSAVQVRTAIDWCQDDEFWRGNVMSMPKLREKYDQLRLAAHRPPPGRAPPSSSVRLDPTAQNYDQARL